MGNLQNGKNAQAHGAIENEPNWFEEDSEAEGTRLLAAEEAHGDERGAGSISTNEVIGSGQPPAVADSLTDTHPTVDSQMEQKETVSWKDLPQKKQLVVITLTRLSEPLVQTSLQAYMFYQLKWFDPTLSDSVVSSQAGILHASFTAAQLLTAMMWGRVADSSLFGRKKVILIGLTGTMISCLGFGFSRTFWQALLFRCLGGITNGNVGVLRTMISEIVKEKRYRRFLVSYMTSLRKRGMIQKRRSHNKNTPRLSMFSKMAMTDSYLRAESRAFLLLPMTFNIGVIIGPILGGVLADPAASYPTVFGKTKFFLDFPYAMPNLLSALFLLSASLIAWLCLEEVSQRKVSP